MQAFTTLRSVAAPLMRDNVNTDVIIRIEHLFGRKSREELGRACFESWRYLPDGSENPEFVMNQDPYRNAQVLLAGHNFACGSSREGAVNALMSMGIRCVIASSFGDIFYNNCFQNGLLPIVLDSASIEALAAEALRAPAVQPVEVDLFRQEVRSAGGRVLGFSVAKLRRDALLQGLDEIQLTLTRNAEISAFQARDRAKRPWIYETHASAIEGTRS